VVVLLVLNAARINAFAWKETSHLCGRRLVGQLKAVVHGELRGRVAPARTRSRGLSG
jgi:hypothetical protein